MNKQDINILWDQLYNLKQKLAENEKRFFAQLENQKELYYEEDYRNHLKNCIRLLNTSVSQLNDIMYDLEEFGSNSDQE